MPIFGYDTAGTAGRSSLNNYIHGSKYYLGETGTAQSLTAYVYMYYADSRLKYAIYDESLNLVAQTEEYVKPSDGVFKNWKTLNLLSPTTLSPGYYWLCAWGNKSYMYIYFDDGETNQALWKKLTYDSWPSTLSPDGYLDRKNSIYCTYEVAAVKPKAIGDGLVLFS